MSNLKTRWAKRAVAALVLTAAAFFATGCGMKCARANGPGTTFTSAEAGVDVSVEVEMQVISFHGRSL